MAGDVAAPDNQYANFFQRRVVRSAQHWQKFVAEKQADTAELERGQAQILRAISFALNSEAAWPATRHLIESFASYMERRGYWDTWHDILTQAIDTAQHFGDTAGQVTLMALLARLLQRQSRYREVVKTYRQVIRLARKTGNRFEEARACSNLGYLYIDSIGRWWRAEMLSCHALAIFEELDSDHGRAHTENHLGFLYTRQRSWDKAEYHLNQACALWQQMGDDHSLIRGFTNLGMMYYEMQHPLEALTYLEKALAQAKLTKEETELGVIWMNIGLAYQQNGELKKAETYTKQAEDVYRQFSNLLGLAQVWDNLGLISVGQKKWTEAKQYLERSLGAYRSLNNWNGEIKALTSIIEYEFAMENYLQAEVRLNELEDVIGRLNQVKQKQYLLQRLKEYRRELSELGN